LFELKKTAVLIVGLLLVSVLPADAITTLVPDLEVGAEYNDNITFVEDEEKIDRILRVSPGISLETRTETLYAELSAQARAHYYDTYTELDGVDEIYMGRVNYRFSPKFSSRVDASYRKDTQYDRDLETTGRLLTADTRDRYQGSIGGTYAPTELTNVALDYSYTEDTFDTSELSDSQIHNLSITFGHNLSWIIPKTTTNLSLSYGQYNYERNLTDTQSYLTGTIETIDEQTTLVDNYGISAGIQYDWSEVLKITLTVGGRYTESTLEQNVTQTLSLPPNPDVEETDKETTDEITRAGTGEVRLTYQGETGQVNLGLSNDIRPASGETSPNTRTELYLLISRRLTEDLRGSLNLRYFINNEDTDPFDVDKRESQTVSIRPTLRYQFHRNLFFRMYYTYTRIQRDDTDEDIFRNLVFAGIEGRYPLFE
jgi:hypothetical protein